MREIYNSILNRLLEASTDAPDSSDLAMSVHRTSNSCTMTLYRPAMLLNLDDIGDYIVDMILDTVVGFADIGAYGRGDCNNAWEVGLMAGPGFGKIMYGACYAASPTGIIMPDRSAVAMPASQAWKKTFNSERPKEPLKPQSNKKRAGTTSGPSWDSTSDGCKLHSEEDGDCKGRARPWLNYSYEAVGWEKPMLETLEKFHKKTADQAINSNLRRFKPIDVLENEILNAGHRFFRKNYHSSL